MRNSQTISRQRPWQCRNPSATKSPIPAPLHLSTPQSANIFTNSSRSSAETGNPCFPTWGEGMKCSSVTHHRDS